MNYSPAIRDLFGPCAGKSPLFSFWTHFPDCDLDPARLAEASVDMQREFDLDFVKTAPNGMYAIEDYGVSVDFSEVPRGGVARLTSTPFETASDWSGLQEADPTKGALGREIASMRMIREALPDIPLFFTLFSPMTIASKLSQGKIHGQIAERTEVDAIHSALQRIAHTTSALAQEAISAGASGVFFAHQDTSRSIYSYDDFSEFVVPYDIEVLTGAARGQFNILHIHGESIRFQELVGYPVQAMNWHDWETVPTAAAGLLSSGKCVIGGIDRWSITNNDLSALKQQVTTTLRTSAGLGDVILAPSCTLRAGFNKQTLRELRDFVSGLE